MEEDENFSKFCNLNLKPSLRYGAYLRKQKTVSHYAVHNVDKQSHVKH